MSYIIDTVAMIFNYIQFAFDYLVTTIKNILGLLKYLRVIQEISYEVLLSLPSFVQPFIILTVTVSILYIILGTPAGGRGNNP